jgi:hypothetical protein
MFLGFIVDILYLMFILYDGLHDAIVLIVEHCHLLLQLFEGSFNNLEIALKTGLL